MNPANATSRWLRRALNLIGVVVVGFYIWRDTLPHSPVWIVVVAFIAVAGWLTEILLPRRLMLAASVALEVMVVAGGVATVATNGVVIVPVAVAIVLALANLERPAWHGLALGLVAAALIPVGALIDPMPVLGLVTMECGIALAILVGISRRQFRASEAQARLLLEERIATREEQARGAALAERQAVARDIHDVLAHSLGGLVIQLDAVEALLEADKPADALARARDARRLAASGLDEARRAVAALRESRDTDREPGAVLQSALDDLVAAHRALGGEIAFEATGEPHEVSASEAHALRQAMQEGLTNARKHAAGERVSASLRWTPAGVDLEMSNPVVAAGEAVASGGHGLVGMAERFHVLAGARVTATERDGRFVLRAHIAAGLS